MGDVDRFSLNQITTKQWSVPQAAAACGARGISWIGLWRDKLAEHGVEATVRTLAEHSLRVSSLCRGGFFAHADPDARAAAARENRSAVEEAAAVGTDVLVLVCGGLGGVTLREARDMVTEGIAALAPYAEEHGVRLAIEALHPVFAADRSVICTLAQALDVAEMFPAEQVGVVVDAYHQWWDPDVDAQIARAAGRILSFQVCDWLDPLPDPLLGRGMMGDGVADLHGMYLAVAAAGYRGPIEVEIFNQAVWDAPGDHTLDRAVQRYASHVLAAP